MRGAMGAMGAALQLGEAACAACGGYIAPWDGACAVGGRRWHQRCLKCEACGGGLGGRERVAVDAAGQPLHWDCHRERLGLRCCVCRQLMPARAVRRATSCSWLMQLMLFNVLQALGLLRLPARLAFHDARQSAAVLASSFVVGQCAFAFGRTA